MIRKLYLKNLKYSKIITLAAEWRMGQRGVRWGDERGHF